MLRITQSSAAAGAKTYYTQALSRQDYYSEGQEITGHWHGQAAARLGLAGAVDQQRFFALCDNRHPLTGDTLTARQKTQRTCGYDFTFSAPKSVALLYALTQDDRLLDAFQASVQETMQEIEGGMQTRVRTHGQETDRPTGNMIWADFTHFTTRPVDGEPDPDLHAHCFAFNVTYDPAEQRCKAGQFREVKRDAPYYEAAFHARLARRMQALGFGVERHGKFWDVAGLPRDLLEKFSRRAAEIERIAQAKGITDPDAKGALGARTRERKALHLRTGALRQAWQDRLSAEDTQAIAAVMDTAENAGADGLVQKTNPQEALRYAVGAAFERASVVRETQLVETALRHAVGDVLPEEIRRAIRHADAGVLTATMDGRRLATTREVLAEEQAMLAFARQGRGACLPFAWPSPDTPAYRSARLNAGQQAAVRHLLASRDRVSLIRGGAGTGKTTLMKEAVREIEAHSGLTVYTFAPTAEAARGVLRAEGFAGAETVARLLVDERVQARVQGQVLWIDEAGLLSTRDMARLFRLAERLGTRVILAGDTRQHGAVQRGDALRLLEAKAGLVPAEVTEILRQRGAYRDAVNALALGWLDDGFARLQDLGWVHEIADDTRHAQLAADYLHTIAQGQTALVVSPTHREADQVTALIRQGLRAQGRLTGEERTVTALRNCYWTEAEKAEAANYHAGLVVQFVQHARGIRRGERFEVLGRAADGTVTARGADGRKVRLPLAHADRFQVYAPHTLAVAAGEVLRITQNSTSQGKRVDNGAMVTVRGFGRDGSLRLAGGGVLGPEFGHLAHGYVTTSHASQGKTVDRVFIAQGAESFRASTREQFYVSVSRGRAQATIYTDDAEALRERIHDSGIRASATELLHGEVDAWARPRREALFGVQAEQARRQRRERALRLRELVLDAMDQEEAIDRDQARRDLPGTLVQDVMHLRGAEPYGYAVER